MKKLLVSTILITFLILAFCSSGWMTRTINLVHGHDMSHVSECCDYAADSHHTDEVIAIAPVLKSFNLPILLFVINFILLSLAYRAIVYTEFELPNFFHRFSRGVFQLE